jgi:hypothetical protein
MVHSVEARWCLYLVGCTYAYGIGTWLFHDNTSIADIAFLTSLCFKAALGVVMAYIIAPLVVRSPFSLFSWILCQAVLIVMSVTSETAFRVLVPFAGEAGFNVYSNLFSQRAAGFGLMHVYGVLTFLEAGFIYATLTQIGKGRRAVLLGLQMVGFALSRSGIPILAIYLAFFSRRLLIAVTLLFLGVSYAIIDRGGVEGVLASVTELGINLVRDRSLKTSSTDATISMYVFPDTPPQKLFGTGRFFESPGYFYGSTDVGYSRLALFGGYPFMLLFIAANCLAVLLIVLTSRANAMLAIALLAIFLVVNLKGLSDIGIFAFVLLFVTVESQRRWQVPAETNIARQLPLSETA